MTIPTHCVFCGEEMVIVMPDVTAAPLNEARCTNCGASCTTDRGNSETVYWVQAPVNWGGASQ